jgi:5'-phosphate synthase pdxT subunit
MSEANLSPIGILAIQGDYAAHERMLLELGVPTRQIRKAEQLDGLAGLILPGGESTTLLKFLDNEQLWPALQEFAASKPVFGTCAGAILLAAEVENPAQRSLAAMDIAVRRNAFGRQIYSFIRHASLSKPFLQELGPAAPEEGKIEAVFIRAPLILKTGKKVKTLISLDGSPVLVRQDNLLAATFHPELSREGQGAYLIHRYFCQMALGQMPSAPVPAA